MASEWLAEAYREKLRPNPNSMTLATVGRDGRPSARIVLLKDLIPSTGYAVFVTNYQSRKGLEFSEEPRAAAVLHWDKLQRQVRLEGRIHLSPADESDRYFAARPWQSQVGAWASEQSRPIATREALVERWRAASRRFGTPPVGPEANDADRCTVTVPRPPHWGAVRLWIDSVELWLEGDFRIHDRARWTRELGPSTPEGLYAPIPWQSQRLQP